MLVRRKIVGILKSQGQTARAWVTVKPGLNGDWFAAEGVSGGIYRQAGGVGNFVLWASTGIAGIAGIAMSNDGSYMLFVSNAIDGSNNVYSVDTTTKEVTQVGAGPTNIRGLCIAPNGDWYVSTVGSGNIYVKVGGAGDWTAVGFAGSWGDLWAGPSGHIYGAAVTGIAKRTSGAGSFAYIDSNARNWRSVCAFSGADGDEVYASDGSLLYKRPVSGGDFVAVTSTSKAWRQMGMDQRRNLYAPEINGNLYKAVNGF